MLRWDEWVPASRLLKYTEANLALQKSLQQQSQAAQATQTGSASSKTHNKAAAGANKDSISTRAGARKDGTRGTKRAREEVSLLAIFLSFCWAGVHGRLANLGRHLCRF